MKTIPLSKGQFAIVENEWFEELSQYKWSAQWNPKSKTFYANRREHRDGKQMLILMHRIITGCPSGLNVDHNDKNGLNNLSGNLRICTNEENCRNRGKTINNTSGFKGVTWFPQTSQWRARIGVKNRKISLGLHYYILDAARAYNEAALKYHGEFAVLNEIPEDIAACH